MRSPIATFSLTALAAALSLGSSGCIAKVLTDGQIEGTRNAAISFDTTGDPDVARTASESSFGQFEGMHALAPYNLNGLYLLTKGWTGYAAGFLLADIEIAQDANNDALEEALRQRARLAFDRAVYYGVQALGQKAEGFDKAKKNATTLNKWLADTFTDKEDAQQLLWTGIAWLLRVDVMKGEDEGPALIADVYIGVAMIERAVALNPATDHYTGVMALASYHARNAMAEPELSKQLFDQALAKTEGRDLSIQVGYATTYACLKGDSALYQKMLNTVLAAGNPDPFQHVENELAKRRARRWLSKKRAKESCGFDLSAGPTASR